MSRRGCRRKGRADATLFSGLLGYFRVQKG
jgi:hypothetical protein